MNCSFSLIYSFTFKGLGKKQKISKEIKFFDKYKQQCKFKDKNL